MYMHLVEQSLDAFRELSKTEDDPEGWLSAEWCPERCKVVHGCKVCMPLIISGELQLQNRYKDATRSKSFSHGNVISDLKRAIPAHSKCKTHKHAVELRALQQAGSAPPAPGMVKGFVNEERRN